MNLINRIEEGQLADVAAESQLRASLSASNRKPRWWAFIGRNWVIAGRNKVSNANELDEQELVEA